MSTKDSADVSKTTTAPSSRRGEVDFLNPTSNTGLATLAAAEAAINHDAGKGAGVVQRAQVDSKKSTDKPREPSKERVSLQKTPPSPARRPNRYALEITFKVETKAGEFTPVDEETYSSDFMVDTLNLVYPGCTGVYLMEVGHVVAFYGKKSSTRAGLTVEQSVDACQIISEVCRWMGQRAKFTAKAISLNEANDMVIGHKRLEKDSLRKARQDILNKLSAWRLGQTGNLSATAKPFIPLATSSAATAIAPSGTLPPPPLVGYNETTRPLYTSDDEGLTVDGGTSQASTQRPAQRRGSRSRHKNKRGIPRDGMISDSGSESSISALSARIGRKKKAGVNAKVNIPDFGDKTSNPDNYASTFQVLGSKCHLLS